MRPMITKRSIVSRRLVCRMVFFVAATWLTNGGSHAHCESIHEAVRTHDIYKVSELLRNNVDVNSRDYSGDYVSHYGRTPLHVAAKEGYKDLVVILLNKEADVMSRDVTESTPLHEAAKGGHKNVADLLLDNGAEVNAKDHDACYSPAHGCEGRPQRCGGTAAG